MSWREEAKEPQNERLRETDRIVARGRRLAKNRGLRYRRCTPCAGWCQVWDGAQLLHAGNAEEVVAWLRGGHE